MEIAVKPTLPTYSGGLGILAGDIVREAADMGVPMVGVTLLPTNGYCKQSIDCEGNQREADNYFDPIKEGLIERSERVTVKIQGRDVQIKAFQYNVIGRKGTVPVFFLSTNGVGNLDWDQCITDKLYGGDHEYHRITQEVVLGIGGQRMLRKLGYDSIHTYHMNDGHAALLTLERLRQHFQESGNLEKAIEKVREECVFTTHTTVPAGIDRFNYGVVGDILRDELPNDITKYAGNDNLNMASLAMFFSRYINGVSIRNAEVARKLFPGYNIDSITNGVHSSTWASQPMQLVFDKYVPEWREDPCNLRNISLLPEKLQKMMLSEIKCAHDIPKAILFDYMKKRNGIEFDPYALTIGFARRFASYKRPDLIFRNLDELIRIVKDTNHPMQLVYAGKAHPRDGIGKELVQKVNRAIKEKLNGHIKSVYLEDYDWLLGQLLTSGVDLWLNTPQRPKEASGTSGMKAALNGVPSLSILDGWWLEGHIEGVTGWSIGPGRGEEGFDGIDDDGDANNLLRKLEERVIPAYYHDGWEKVILGSIVQNASYFNTRRMLREYAGKAWGLTLEERVTQNKINDR